MRDLWTIFGQLDNCLFVGVALISLGCAGWAAWIRDNAQKSNLKLTSSEYYQMVISIFFASITGILALGLLISHDNTIKLIELLRLKGVMDKMARLVQGGILWVLRFMM